MSNGKVTYGAFGVYTTNSTLQAELYRADKVAFAALTVPGLVNSRSYAGTFSVGPTEVRLLLKVGATIVEKTFGPVGNLQASTDALTIGGVRSINSVGVGSTFLDYNDRITYWNRELTRDEAIAYINAGPCHQAIKAPCC